MRATPTSGGTSPIAISRYRLGQEVSPHRRVGTSGPVAGALQGKRGKGTKFA